MKVVAIAGGVGGAKMVDGFAQLLAGNDVTVIVNTADDFEHLGLWICPDLDTVCYTLANLANPETGWGREGETWNALNSISLLGGPDWFRLGDADLGLHLERTRRLKNGARLSEVTRYFCSVLGVSTVVLPMSDQKVSTIVHTEEGNLHFQEYFVHRNCQPSVSGFEFEGIHDAKPTQGVIQMLKEANLIVICPSNPWVSIDPVLAVDGIRKTLQDRMCVIAVTPIIAGQAIKGPAAKMYTELGISASAVSVARHYSDFIDGFVLDKTDATLLAEIEKMGVKVLISDTIMKNRKDRSRLGKEVLEFGLNILP